MYFHVIHCKVKIIEIFLRLLVDLAWFNIFFMLTPKEYDTKFNQLVLLITDEFLSLIFISTITKAFSIFHSVLFVLYRECENLPFSLSFNCSFVLQI